MKIISIVIVFLLKLRVVYNISDRAIILLLRFFKFLLLMVGGTFCIPDLNEGIYFPQSLRGCYSYLDLATTPYREHIVCPTCHLLYDTNVQSLILGTARRQTSDKCSFVEFPNHPQERFRLPCNAILLNQVPKKKITFKPRRVYYYYGLRAALPVLLKRPSFLSTCNLWVQNKNDNILADITDGKNL